MSDDLVKMCRRLSKYAHAQLSSADLELIADRIEQLEDKLAKVVEALENVMVGGNHLAILLPDNFPPADTTPLTSLGIMGAGRDFDVWCCWRSIMLARTTLAELKGQDDE